MHPQLKQALLDLPDLERARAIRRVLRERNWTQVRLAEELGVPAFKLSKDLSLLRLCPEVQLLLDSKLPEGERLHYITALMLTNKSPKVQLAAVKDMSGTNTQQEQVGRICQNLKKYYNDLHGISSEKIREAIEVARAEVAAHKPVKAAPPPKPVKPLSVPKPTAPPKAPDEKRPVAVVPPRVTPTVVMTPVPKPEVCVTPLPEVDRSVPPVVAAEPVARPQVKRPTAPAKDKHLGAASQGWSTPVPRQSASDAPVNGTASHGFTTDEVAVEYWDERIVRFVFGKVDLRKYRELAAAGHLKYQRDKKERPSHYPDPDQF